jgi:biopolymer transport protein ExbB
MGQTKKNSKTNASNIFAALTILICIAIGFCIWKFIMGDSSNFENGDNTGHPLDGNIFGMIYKGGYIVPVLIGLLLTSIVFSIERLVVLNKAEGKGNLNKFVNKVQASISQGEIDEAISACDKQRGAVANVINAALIKFKEVSAEGLNADEASETIGKEVEEATSLEMPTMEKNMTILATLVSIGTLFGLLGTVTGMIKAFAGLSVAGTPDTAQLATGISEALINTATGIGTSILATIAYNFFTAKIDTLTYFIDEAGFAITQSYVKKSK